MKKILLLAVPVFLLLVGCTTSKVTTSWVSRDANLSKTHLNRILVMGLLSNKNRSSNVSMENHLVQELKNKGFNVVASTETYGPRAFDKMSEEEALGQLTQKGIDGVITITMIDKAKKEQYVNNYWGGPYSWWGYYSYWHPFMWGSMGYVRKYSSYTFETNLYDLKSAKQMIYSAHSETNDPSSAQSLGKDYGKSIVDDLMKKGLVN